MFSGSLRSPESGNTTVSAPIYAPSSRSSAGSQFPRRNYSAANPKNTTCCKVGSFSSVTGTRMEKHCSAIAPLIAVLLMGRKTASLEDFQDDDHNRITGVGSGCQVKSSVHTAINLILVSSIMSVHIAINLFLVSSIIKC